MGLLLGLDAGTTSLKAGLYDESGAARAVAVEEYRLLTPSPDRVELDPARYWEAAGTAVRQAMATSGAGPADVTAMAVSSQGETLVAVAADGRPLGPAIVWLDNRADDEAAELAARFDPSEVYERTGVPAVVPTWPACKLLWLRRHEPERFGAAARFLLVEDLLLHRLTGRFVTEGGVQSTSLLYDIRRDAWWPAMLEAVGLEPERLPELARPGSVVGRLSGRAAAELGLAAGIPVVAGGMDQGAGAVGVGNVGSGLVSESTGGALTLQASVPRPDGDPSRQTPVYVHSAPEGYLYCPVCPTGGMALTWFRDRFGEDLVARSRAEGRSAYDLLTELAAAVPPGSDGLVMLPHLSGAFSPEYEPRARGVFFGFTLGHERGHFVRAVLEAVAFMLRRNLELLTVAGAEAVEIRSHGGGARSPLWNQVKADVCGLPVVTLEGADAAVLGDAMLAGVAVGAFRDLAEATEAMVRPAARYEPRPAAVAVYESSYRRYVELFDVLRPLFAADPSPAAVVGRGAGE
ncbi:MAG TPA: FGGY family carbohydrate kinase [Candidatus Limnocylindrales bacterium]